MYTEIVIKGRIGTHSTPEEIWDTTSLQDICQSTSCSMLMTLVLLPAPLHRAHQVSELVRPRQVSQPCSTLLIREEWRSQLTSPIHHAQETPGFRCFDGV